MPDNAEYQNLCFSFPLPAYLEAQGWVINQCNRRQTDADGRWVPNTGVEVERGWIRFAHPSKAGHHPDHWGDATRSGLEIMVYRRKNRENKWVCQTRDTQVMLNAVEFVQHEGSYDTGRLLTIQEAKRIMYAFMRMEQTPAIVEQTAAFCPNIEAARLLVASRPHKEIDDCTLAQRLQNASDIDAKRDAVVKEQRTQSRPGSPYSRPQPTSKRQVTDDDRLRRVQYRWNKCKPGTISKYLLSRGIKREVLQTFKDYIRLEPATFIVNQQVVKSEFEGGIAIAHTDENNVVVGYERKASTRFGKTISEFVAGGTKLITRMRNCHKDAPLKNIYVGESVVDLLSIYQFDGQPANSILCSLYGQSSQMAKDEVGKLAMKNPDAMNNLCFDSDNAGKKFAYDMQKTVLRWSPDSLIENRVPDDEYKDWNCVINGITRDREREHKIEKAQAWVYAESDKITQRPLDEVPGAMAGLRALARQFCEQHDCALEFAPGQRLMSTRLAQERVREIEQRIATMPPEEAARATDRLLQHVERFRIETGISIALHVLEPANDVGLRGMGVY